jgi:Heterokaryon incompatibility protein (HET)
MSAAETSDGNENDFKNISRLPTFQTSSHSCSIHYASTSAPKFGCFDESKSILGCSLLYRPPGVWAQLAITSHKTDARQVFIGISPPLMAAYNLTRVPHSTDSLGRQLAPYPYQPLDFDTHEIRLLVLKCPPIKKNARPQQYYHFLEHVSLIDPGPYYALSYCWGNPTRYYYIALDGSTALVRSNLLSALVSVRKYQRKKYPDDHNDIRIWVDAVCINQNDGKERSQQVQHMRQIYSMATEVLTWAGPSGDVVVPEGVPKQMPIALIQDLRRKDQNDFA